MTAQMCFIDDTLGMSKGLGRMRSNGIFVRCYELDGRNVAEKPGATEESCEPHAWLNYTPILSQVFEEETLFRVISWIDCSLEQAGDNDPRNHTK
jgi:hypothetical protein